MSPSVPEQFRWDGEIFTCAVTLASVGAPLTAFPDVVTELRALDRRFSRFAAGSEISRFNAGAGAWQEVSPELHRLLRFGLLAAEASDGLVNLAVLPALEAAGYDRSWPFPDPAAQLDAVRVPTLATVLELRPRRALLRRGAAVDVGGIAKGAWADEVVDRLGGNAVCSLGGDLACRGGGPDGEGWPITITGGTPYLVRNAAVATSGTSRRAWGAGRHHIVDPRTGLPSASDVRTCSVLAPSAAAAEWLATAVVVGGTAAADRFARSHPHIEITIERTAADDERPQLDRQAC